MAQEATGPQRPLLKKVAPKPLAAKYLENKAFKLPAGLPVALETPLKYERPTTPTYSEAIYSVSAPNGSRWTDTVQSAQQSFVNTANCLNELRLDVSGSGQVRVMVERQGGGIVLDRNVTLGPENTGAIIRCDPPVMLEMGDLYNVWVERSRTTPNFKIAGHPDRDAYVFSRGSIKKNENWMWAPGDLAMEVVGTRNGLRSQDPRGTRPARSQKALVIFLENGGVSLESVEGLENITLPDIRYATCGSFRFRMQPNESIGQMISRVRQQIGMNLNCLNPTNWEIKSLTFEEWWQPISDYMAEEVTKSIRLAQDRNTPQKYDKVVLLEDSNATAARLLQEIQTLAPQYMLDVHILAHGYPEGFVGQNEDAVSVNTFFAPLMGRIMKGTLPLNLRAVYQMNCASGTLVKKWQALGAQVVNGTNDDDLNWMPPQYFNFNQRWLNNETFAEATSRSHEDAKPFFQVAYVNAPNRITESRLNTAGNGSLRMPSQ